MLTTTAIKLLTLTPLARSSTRTFVQTPTWPAARASMGRRRPRRSCVPRPRGETGYGQRAPKETWKDRTQGPLGTDSFGAKRRKITYRSDASSDSAGAQRPRSTRIRQPMKAPRAPALRKPSRAPNMNATFQPVEKLSALKLDHNRPPPMPHAADGEYPTCEEVSAREEALRKRR